MKKDKTRATIELMTKLTGKTVFPLHTVYSNQLVTTKITGKGFEEFQYEAEMLYIFLMINIPHQTYHKLRELLNTEEKLKQLKELIKKHGVLR